MLQYIVVGWFFESLAAAITVAIFGTAGCFENLELSERFPCQPVGFTEPQNLGDLARIAALYALWAMAFVSMLGALAVTLYACVRAAEFVAKQPLPWSTNRALTSTKPEPGTELRPR